jgi:hypothetical protein
MEKDFIRIQLQHDESHNEYTSKELEDALQKLNLSEISLHFTDKEGVIRHKAGLEIIISVKSLVNHASAILSLASAWKKNDVESRIQITVSSPYELKLILDALKSEYL